MVSSFLSSVIQAFLVRHGFYTLDPQDRRRETHEESRSPPSTPSKRRKRDLLIDDISQPIPSASTTLEESGKANANASPIYAYHVRFFLHAIYANLIMFS